MLTLFKIAAAVLLLSGILNAQANPAETHKAFVIRYCSGCHNQRAKIAGLMLDTFDIAQPGNNPKVFFSQIS